MPLWVAYVTATFCASASRAGASLAELDQLMIFAPWRDRMARARYLQYLSTTESRGRHLMESLLSVIPVPGFPDPAEEAARQSAAPPSATFTVAVERKGDGS